MTPTIEAAGLRKRFGKTVALDGLDLVAEPGQVTLTEGGKLLVSKMSQDQKAALRKLQDYERLVAAKSFKMQEEVLTPVEEKIQEELFSRKVQ